MQMINRSKNTVRIKRKYTSAKAETSGNVTEDSMDFFTTDIENSKYHKHANNFDREYDDSNDSYSKDVSFNDKDYSNSMLERKLRQRGAHSKSTDYTRLQQCLDYIHRILSRKDKEDFFQYPVTDLIAPGYSSIIKKPMDFSTMKKKIDNCVYNNVLEYRDDFVLMCENAMTYNKSDTIYYYAARKLLDSGLKLLNKDKLVSLRRTLSFMKNLTTTELGFVPEGEVETPPENSLLVAYRKKQSIKTNSNKYEFNQNQIISKSNILQKLQALSSERKETPEEILSECQLLAKNASEKLSARFPNSKLGFLRRNSNGTTSLNFLDQDDNTIDKQLTVGSLCEALDSGSYSLNSFIEEKKNKAKPMYYLEYGPFSSHAPTYDSSFSNISKEESDLLMSTYGDEAAYQYSLSLMEFAKGTGPLFGKYVNYVLNLLTNNEHEKFLSSKRQLDLNKTQNQNNFTENISSNENTSTLNNNIDNTTIKINTDTNSNDAKNMNKIDNLNIDSSRIEETLNNPKISYEVSKNTENLLLKEHELTDKIEENFTEQQQIQSEEVINTQLECKINENFGE